MTPKRVFSVITTIGVLALGLSLTQFFTATPSLPLVIAGFPGLAMVIDGLALWALQDPNLRSRFFRITTYIGLCTFNVGFALAPLLLLLNATFAEFLPVLLLSVCGMFMLLVPFAYLILLQLQTSSATATATMGFDLRLGLLRMSLWLNRRLGGRGSTTGLYPVVLAIGTAVVVLGIIQKTIGGINAPVGAVVLLIVSVAAMLMLRQHRRQKLQSDAI